MPDVLEEPFHLTDNDPGVTEADGTSSTWSDIWDYEVPIGVAHRLSSEHTISLYLEDTSPAEVGNTTCNVRIEVRDPSGQDSYRVAGPFLYIQAREFTNRPAMAHISANDYLVREREHIVIQVNDDATIDASDSYFDLFISRVRQSLAGA